MIGLETAELQQLADYRLVLDCPEISLIPLSSNSPNPNFVGSGSIIQNDEGRLVLKLICKEANLQVAFAMGKELVPEYFSFSAFDINGRKWTAGKIRPSTISSASNRGYLMVSCDIPELTTVFSSPTARNHNLEILFPGNIDIPCNIPTITEVSVKGEKRQSSLKTDRAHFETNNFSIEIAKGTDWLQCTAESTSSPITDSVISAFLESLQFVLARPLEWSVMQVSPEGKNRITKVRASFRNKPPLRRWPPLHLTNPSRASYVWDLFAKYFTYSLTKWQKDSKPTMFQHIESVLLARLALLPTEVLTLGVAVEGILKDTFPKNRNNDEELDEQICKAQEIITQSGLTEKAKERILRFLPTMRNLRPIDQLYLLKQENLIDEQLIKAWEKLRNSATHATPMDPNQYESYMDRYRAVTMLLHKLIFLVIGYTGPYTEYLSYPYRAQIFAPKK